MTGPERDERIRRWRLALGGEEDGLLDVTDGRIDRALSALYAGSAAGQGARR